MHSAKGLSFLQISQCKKNGLEHAFVGDAQDFEVPTDFPDHLRGGFDAVFSNAALHWCKRKPEGVLTCARRILKPGGRFVIEMGGLMNCVGEHISFLHPANNLTKGAR